MCDEVPTYRCIYCNVSYTKDEVSHKVSHVECVCVGCSDTRETAYKASIGCICHGWRDTEHCTAH